MLNFFEVNFGTLAKAFDFNSASSRREYWSFILFGWIALSVAMIADSFIFGDFIYNIVTVLFFLPYLAVSVRRMHDTNHRGWWILVPVASLFLLFAPTVPNRWQNIESTGPTGVSL